MDITPNWEKMFGGGKGKAAAGAYKFKKSKSANDAEMRYRTDEEGRSGFGANTFGTRPQKPVGATARKRSPRMDESGNTGFGATQSKPRKTTPRKPKGEGWMNMAPPNMTPKWRQKGPVGIPAPRKPKGYMGIMNRRPARKMGK